MAAKAPSNAAGLAHVEELRLQTPTPGPLLRFSHHEGMGRIGGTSTGAPPGRARDRFREHLDVFSLHPTGALATPVMLRRDVRDWPRALRDGIGRGPR